MMFFLNFRAYRFCTPFAEKVGADKLVTLRDDFRFQNGFSLWIPYGFCFIELLCFRVLYPPLPTKRSALFGAYRSTRTIFLSGKVPSRCRFLVSSSCAPPRIVSPCPLSTLLQLSNRPSRTLSRVSESNSPKNVWNFSAGSSTVP